MRAIRNVTRAVGEQRDDGHHERGLGPLAAERDKDREGAGDPGADERDVGSGEGDHGDRPRERHAEDQRRAPITTALKAAMIVTPRK